MKTPQQLAHDAYHKAAAIIEKRGLHKGEYYDSDGSRRLCMGAAIVEAQGGQLLGNSSLQTVGDRDAYNAIAAHENDLLGAEDFALANFNDAPDTTQDDVVVMLHLMAHDALNYWDGA